MLCYIILYYAIIHTKHIRIQEKGSRDGEADENIWYACTLRAFGLNMTDQCRQNEKGGVRKRGARTNIRMDSGISYPPYLPLFHSGNNASARRPSQRVRRPQRLRMSGPRGPLRHKHISYYYYYYYYYYYLYYY